MVSCNVGAAPVLEGTRLVGIFSERDIMRRVVTEGRNPLTTHVADVMSTRISTVSPSDTSESAMALMQEHGVRHLPVCEGTVLVGFLSLRDLLRCHLDEKSADNDMMRAYIQTSS
jgi:CBS domain-containing protein